MPRLTVQYIVNKYKKKMEEWQLSIASSNEKSKPIEDNLLHLSMRRQEEKSVLSFTSVLFEILSMKLAYMALEPKKTLLNNCNQSKPMQYAKTMTEKAFSFQKNVFRSDKSKFNFFSVDGKIMVQRLKTAEFSLQYTVSTIKY